MTATSTPPALLTGPVLPDLLRTETLASMFRASALRFGHKTACVFGTQSYTYRQLDIWSDHIAVQLQQNGIHKGDFVGVWWPRGIILHAIIIGIVKSGAAYVPLDYEMPAERVQTVLSEVGASAYFSEKDISIRIKCLNPIYDEAPIQNDQLPEGPDSDSIAYVLYTSGSTGRPKGIPITQKMICHLVRAENEILAIQEQDYIYQGFSVSFDMWCEECWIAYFVGATLYIADATQAKAVDELSTLLREQKVTVLHAVPSLLAVMDEDIPSLRLVNAGGEACSPQVLQRWAKEGIRFFNSYGPTETTVSASMAELKPGDKISIGLPLPNYNFAVVDEQLQPVGFDVQGELVILGPGLSNGYINRPELNAEKFIPKPAQLDFVAGARLYKTGDAVSISQNGTVTFFGRLDDQVKLRGYRIELGEIETQLAAIPGVKAAALAIKKDNLNNEHLVAYAVLAKGVILHEATWRKALAASLPSYMLPDLLVVLAEMPRLASGKTDRKSLATPEALSQFTALQDEDILNTEAPFSEKILQLLQLTFPGKQPNENQDFFTDLGGHSLIAAGFVSKVRKQLNCPQASLKDIYVQRPIAQLIACWEAKTTKTESTKVPFHKISKVRHFFCWLAQTLVLAPILGLYALQIFSPFLAYYYTQFNTGSHLKALLASILAFMLVPPVYTCIAIASKWLIIGKYEEGDYPMWGTYFFRWWTVKKIQNLMPNQLMVGTPLAPKLLNLLGAKVAANAQLSNLSIGAEDLIEIGANASISSAVVFDNAYVEDGLFKIRRIKVGAHAYIGTSSVLGGNTHVADWGELGDLSALSEGAKIGQAGIWKGSPAQHVADRPEALCVPPDEERKRNKVKYTFVLWLTLIIFPLVILLPLLPTIITLSELDNAAADYNFNYVVVVPLLSFSYLLLFILETVLISRILMRKVQPGIYSVYSVTYWRKWLADTLFNISLVILHPLFASVYVAFFYRALGARVGKNTEISTASNVTHTMLSIGDGSFVADAVTLGEADVRNQQLILQTTSIGQNTFIGNSANVPQGTHLPNDILLGVLSQAPENEALKAQHSDWFGSPAIALPRRQESNSFSASRTTKPPLHLKMCRAFIEALRILLPQSLVITMSIFFIAYSIDIIAEKPWYICAMTLPFLYVLFMGLPSVIITVLLKWIIVGKHKKEQVPLYSFKVWRSEAITTTYEALSIPYMLEFLKGTPWLPIVLRLFGVKTGKRVYMDTCDITEADLVSIGDEAALNQDCGPQTHLFEDRVMKTGNVSIGTRSSVRARSIILYDSVLGDGVNLAPLSLVMKGELLEQDTRWAGSPVKSA